MLFTITFKATKDLRISEGLDVSSKVTTAEAYTSKEELLGVDFVYNSSSTGTTGSTGWTGSSGKEVSYNLLQNTPNPFSDYTKIGFEIPNSGAATIKIFDVTGKVVFERSDDFNSGYNEVSVRKADIGSTGVLYYQLETGALIATKKMIVIH